LKSRRTFRVSRLTFHVSRLSRTCPQMPRHRRGAGACARHPADRFSRNAIPYTKPRHV